MSTKKYSLGLLAVRLLRHAFLSGYDAALEKATLEMDGAKAWSNYEPEEKDWGRFIGHLLKPPASEVDNPTRDTKKAEKHTKSLDIG